MKALFIPFAPSLAHVSRCLAAAEAWRARGHTAIFAIGTERKALVQSAGFDIRSVPEVPGEVFRTDQGFRWLTSEYFSDNLAAEQRILAEVKPDMVVFDFRFTTALAARLGGLPSVSILHGNALRLALHPQETARLLIGDIQTARGVAAWRLNVLRKLFPLGFQLFMRMVVRRFAPLLKAHHCPPVDSPFGLLLGDEILAADLPDLLPAALPPRTHLVGPLMWSGWERSAPWLAEFDDRPLIYVTMGSTVEAQTTLVNIIDALRDGVYNVVVSTGSLALPGNLELPDHIRLFATVPGATVAQRSVVVVHHGGHETLMQALAAGIPSMILPANPDQILAAQQAQKLGIGYSLWRPGHLPVDAGWLRSITPTKIRRAIDHLVADQSYSKVCQSFKPQFEAYRGAILAANTLEGIASMSRGR